MPTANINILAVLVAAVLTFVLGAVWYSPVLFAKQWMAAQGYTPEKLEEMKRRGVTRAYAVSVLCYLVTAYVMALLASYTNSTTLAQGLWLGFLSWLGVAAPVGRSEERRVGETIAPRGADPGVNGRGAGRGKGGISGGAGI